MVKRPESRSEVFRRLLHRVPGWDESVTRARANLGFSFGRGAAANWSWLAEGNYTGVWERAGDALGDLGLPPVYELYWVCCFFSEYRNTSGGWDWRAIKGPPFLEISCPVDGGDERWSRSIEAGRAWLSDRAGSVPIGAWVQDPRGMASLSEYARARVVVLGCPDQLPHWLCSVLPRGMGWIVGRGRWSVRWLRQASEWDHFGCAHRESPYRQRALPTGLDYSDRPPEATRGLISAVRADAGTRARIEGFERAEEHRLSGIEFGVDHTALRLSMTWDPRLVTARELVDAVRYHQSEHGDHLARSARDALSVLIREGLRAEQLPGRERILDSRRRYESGEADFETLLVEEALGPGMQQEWATARRFLRSRQARDEARQRLRMKVYSRVRKRLLKVDPRPSVYRSGSPWWEGLFPDDSR